MSLKSRGTAAERELVNRFWGVGWAAMRAAGSGSSQFPSPDVLASNTARKLAIEVKLTTESKKYFTAKEVNELQYFAEKFGAEGWIAVKFVREGWFFLPLDDLEETGASFAVSLGRAHTVGLSFDELVDML